MDFMLSVWRTDERVEGSLPFVTQLTLGSLEYAKRLGERITSHGGGLFAWEVLAWQDGAWGVVARSEEIS